MIQRIITMKRIKIFRRLCSSTSSSTATLIEQKISNTKAVTKANHANTKIIYERVGLSEPVPIALQYMYGASTKKQTKALEDPEEIDVAGLMVNSEDNQEFPKPVYPFAIYDSLKEAKYEAENDASIKDSKSSREENEFEEKFDSKIPTSKRTRRRRRENLSKEEPKDQNETNVQTMKDQPKQDEELNEEDIFRHGTADPEIPSSKIPCSGCGAHLHCQDSKMPGFLPWEIFQKIRNSKRRLRKSQCQRCILINDYNVALKMNVKAEDYPKALSHIKDKRGLVILVTDLTDFPGSVWPDIFELLGKNKSVILVGNKVDLLPQDCNKFTENIKNSMIQTFEQKCKESGSNQHEATEIVDSILVSARTGYNMEKLINLVLKNWNEKQKYFGRNVYLVGTTNVGKSSIFNILLDSDLCDIKALNRIEKATIAPVPGTTLNLLKFPILRPEPGQLNQRYSRLSDDKVVIEQMEQERIENLRKTKSIDYTTAHHPVGYTFQYLQDKSLATNTSAFEMSLKRQKQNRTSPELDFNPWDYKENKWCFDTPGTVCNDQIINFLTQEEIKNVMPALPMTPRSLNVKKGHSVLIGGIARLDVMQGSADVKWEHWPLTLTVFCSDTLPINVIETENVEDFYKEAFDQLVVPSASNSQRLNEFPKLEGKELEVYGISPFESACDIVLSSIGWIAVTTRVTLLYQVKAWTPGGKGIFLRDPPFLPHAVKLRGKKIKGTSYFQKSKIFIPDHIESMKWK